jgi:hypothetical protein
MKMQLNNTCCLQPPLFCGPHCKNAVGVEEYIIMSHFCVWCKRLKFKHTCENAVEQYVSFATPFVLRPSLQVGVEEFIKRDFDNIFDFLDLRRLLPLLGQGEGVLC